MGELRRQLRLYWLLQRASLRGAVQFRANIAITVLAGFAYQGSGFAFLWVLMQTVPSMAGWTLPELALLYGMRLISHALWLVTMGGIHYLEESVREGRFERVLLRPANPFLQVAATTRSLLPLGDLTAGLLVAGVAVAAADIDWSPVTVLVLLLGLVGGALVEGAAMLAVSSLSMRFVQTWAVRWFVDDSLSVLGSYPLPVFGTAAQRVLTYALPVAFVAYLPASAVLDRTDDAAVPGFLAYLSPLVGALLFWLAYKLWMSQLKGYQGAGG